MTEQNTTSSTCCALYHRGAVLRLSRVLSRRDRRDAGFAAAAVVRPVAGEAGGVYGADAPPTLAQGCGRQRGGRGGGGGG